MMDHPIEGQTPEEFWAARYETNSKTSGKPTHTLERYVTGRTPGDALDLGCARGDDVVWLAKQGWQVLGVDIAQAALDHTAGNAARHQVAERVRLERHNLAESFPDGRFDLVSASFLQTPFDFPWAAVIRRAAAALRPDGLLVTATHQRVTPQPGKPPKLDLPDAVTLMATLDLVDAKWREVFVGPFERMAKLPNGKTAETTDALIVLERTHV